MNIEFKSYTFDEICDSRDFGHEEEFVLKEDVNIEMSKLKHRLELLQRAGVLILHSVCAGEPCICKDIELWNKEYRGLNGK